MNERIQELWEQAVHGDGPHASVIADFAELIVRGCVKSIEYTIQTNCDTDSEKMGCEFAISDLKERFGVE